MLKHLARHLLGEESYCNLRSSYRHISSGLRSQRLSAIYLDISGRCNLNCVMCSFQEWFHPKGLMSIDILKRLDNVVPTVDKICLQVTGEPLLNRHVVDFVAGIKRLNEKAWVGFTTNGVLLTRSLAAELLEAGINDIRISLDGATKGTYEAIRKGSEFETVLENIRGLVAQRKSCKNQLSTIGLAVVAQAANVQELSAILDLADELQVDGVYFNGLDVFYEDSNPI